MMRLFKFTEKTRLQNGRIADSCAPRWKEAWNLCRTISDEAYQAASSLYESIYASGIHPQMAVAEAFHRLNELCNPEQWRLLLEYLSLDEKLVDRQLKKWSKWQHELAIMEPEIGDRQV